MKRTLSLFFALVVSLNLVTASEYREFTDLEGRKIKAAITRANLEEVWIRREDGRSFRVPITRFTEADQIFIHDWRLLADLQRPRSLEISARRYVEERSRHQTRSTRVQNQLMGYSVTLKNNLPVDVKGIEAEYRMFVRRGSVGSTGQNRTLERLSGRARLDEMPARDEVEFKTQTVSLQSSNLNQGWVYVDPSNRRTNQRRVSDDLAGVWVRFFRNGEMVAEFSYPGGLKERENW